MTTGAMTEEHRERLMKAARWPALIAGGGLLFSVALLFTPETRMPGAIKLAMTALAFGWFFAYPAWIAIPRILDARSRAVGEVRGAVEKKISTAIHQSSSYISSIKVRVPGSSWLKVLELEHLAGVKEGRSYALYHARRSRVFLYAEPIDEA